MEPMHPVDPTDVRGGEPWSWGTPKSWALRGWPMIAAALVIYLFPNKSFGWFVVVGLVGIVPIVVVQVIHSARARSRRRRGAR